MLTANEARSMGQSGNYETKAINNLFSKIVKEALNDKSSVTFEVYYSLFDKFLQQLHKLGYVVDVVCNNPDEGTYTIKIEW